MKKYQIIVCDCPFSFQDNLEMSDVARGADSNYKTLSLRDLKELKVKEISDPEGCLLAFWVPSSMLQDGLNIMNAWGFEQKQTYIWVKVKKDPFISFDALKKLDVKDLFKQIKEFDLSKVLTMNLGRIYRQTHELCLIGINSTKIYKKLKNKSQRSVCFDQNFRHSQKPEELQNSLELMFPDEGINKAELFSRRERSNWDCYGNESPKTLGEDIRVSIDKIISGEYV